MAVNEMDFETRGQKFVGHHIRRLLPANGTVLAMPIAVENRANGRETLLNDEVYSLPDLSFSAFAIANEAKNALI